MTTLIGIAQQDPNGLQFKRIVGFATQNGLTANPGGGRSGATVINVNNGGIALASVTTVATANDSVVLGPAMADSTVVVIMTGANQLALFANGSDTINGIPGSTAWTINSGPNGFRASFDCLVDGAWIGTGYFI